MTKQPKVAIVHDWLTNMGGAEKTVLALAKAFPGAPIYTSVYTPKTMPAFANLDIRTTYLQKLPESLRARHQFFPVARAEAFRKLNLNKFDIIISSASAEAKAVRKRPDATHICYCHTPTRYYWSHYGDYLAKPGFGALNPAIRLALPAFVNTMRRIDLRAVKGVDHFIANSHETQERIKKYYHREANIIFPPVDTARLTPQKPVEKDNYYLIVGRQIPYKRFDLAIEACNRLGKHLIVIGNGSEHEKLRSIAGPTIEFKTNVDDQAIVSYFQKAKAFIFPAEEDFGIVPVEAMSAGTPAIAYKKGGALDYVVGDKTGVFFEEQTVPSLCRAIEECEAASFESHTIITHAAAFSEDRFVREMQSFVNSVV